MLRRLADRFEDGIFAWQLHYSDGFEDVQVIPNDFLTIRSFTFSQVGIEVAKHEPGSELVIRIPRGGTIPNPIVPGDVVDVHALWLQQPPLVSLTVPDVVVAFGDAGGGGDTFLDGEPSASPVPTQVEYVRGELIRHRFAMVDPATGGAMDRGTASYSLLRIRSDGPPVFERFGHIRQDPDTRIRAYEIDTTPLQEAVYELMVSTSVDAAPSTILLEVVPQNGGR